MSELEGTGTVKIRKAHKEDIEDCVGLSRIDEFKLPDGKYPDAEYFELALDKIFFVAEEDGKIIGLIVGYPLDKKSVYLDLLTVHKDARGKNLGKRLLDEFRKELKKKGLKDYFLIAPNSNEKTLNFYRKNGLKEGKRYTLFMESLKTL